MKAETIRGNTLQKFEKDAQVYEQTSDGRFCARAYAEILKEINAAPYHSLLDIGCGTGSILSQIPKEKRRCGIDLSGNMISRAKKTLGGTAELMVGDAESLPWPQNSFDTVCCTFSFHHYPHPGKVLSEANRVLKADGRLLLADPWMPKPFLPILNVLMRFSKDGDFHEYSKREITKLLAANGFAVTVFRHPTNDSFLLTARKSSEERVIGND